MVVVRQSSAPAMPLARLLALAYRQLIDDLHARLATSGYDDVRPAFGYVLLAIREKPVTGVDIGVLLGVSKQAASKLIDEMERRGYVERRSHREDARAKQVAITARGRRFLVVVESIYGDIEKEWARAIGRSRLEAIRDDLRTLVETAHEGQLPPIRPTR